MANVKNTVLVKVIAHKFNCPIGWAEQVAKDMLEDDFPRNDIRTMGEAIAYLENLKKLMEANSG